MAIVYEQDLPKDVPAVLPVFSFAEPASFPTILAQLFALAAAVRQDADGTSGQLCFVDAWTTYRQGDARYAINGRSGGFHVGRSERFAFPAFDLPDEAVTRVATDLVRRAGFPVERMTLHSVTHLRMAGGGRDGEILPERVLDAEVSFRRTVDGIAVDGPGGLLSVRVAGDASILAARFVFRTVRSMVTPVRIRPPDQVRAAFERVAATKRGDVTVTDASFGYFELGVDDRQTYFQPAYSLIYEVRGDDIGYRSAFVQHAGERVFERLAGPRRFSLGPKLEHAAAAPPPPAAASPSPAAEAVAVAKPAARTKRKRATVPKAAP